MLRNKLCILIVFENPVIRPSLLDSIFSVGIENASHNTEILTVQDRCKRANKLIEIRTETVNRNKFSPSFNGRTSELPLNVQNRLTLILLVWRIG
jgi:hypothetical protein